MTRARFAGVVVLLAVAAFCLTPAAAGATEVSSAQLRTLAEEAVDDPAALAELRRVDSVDGRPMDVAGALRGARGDELEERLLHLAESIPTRAGQAAGDPRAEARDVLAEGRFHGTSVPGPFRGLHRVARGPAARLRRVARLARRPPARRALGRLGRARRRARRGRVVGRAPLPQPPRARGDGGRGRRRRPDRRPPGARAPGRRRGGGRRPRDGAAPALPRRPAAARRARRDRVPPVDLDASRCAARCAREDFDALAATFDDVVYGGRPPEGEDVAAARERWPAVVSAAREREAVA